MGTTRNIHVLEARRLLAAKLLQDHGVSEVARLLDVAKSSVSEWKERLQAGGVEALKAKPHPGPKPRLSAEQKEQLVKLLLRGAQAAGYANDLWTCPRVAELIVEHFGVHYNTNYVWEILQSLGWSWQKPEHRARERDAEAIERWRTEDWPRIKKGVRTKTC